MIRIARKAAAATVCLALLLSWGAWASAASGAAASLAQEIGAALTHARFALDSPDDAGFQLHAHHVVNILVGAQGMGFDASWGNPGDGYGAVEYARDLRADQTVAAAGWQTTAQNVAGWLEQAAENALAATRLIAAGDTVTARSRLVTAVAFLSAALGRDGDEGQTAGALALSEALSGFADAAPAAPDPFGAYY